MVGTNCSDPTLDPFKNRFCGVGFRCELNAESSNPTQLKTSLGVELTIFRIPPLVIRPPWISGAVDPEWLVVSPQSTPKKTEYRKPSSERVPLGGPLPVMLPNPIVTGVASAAVVPKW